MDNINLFFDGWDPIFRILVVGSLSYIILLFLLRLSGKRTLAQMSGFDFVITVAIGSSFGRLITASEVSLAESTTAFLLLLTLQVVFGYLDSRFGWFSRIVKSQPTLLFYKGSFLEESIRHCRVNKDEILGVVRQQGIESLDEVEAIVLETSGGWSVVKKGNDFIGIEKSALRPLKQAREAKKQDKKKEKDEKKQ